MKFEDTNVLFTGRLLSLDQPCSILNADNQAASYLGIESPTVTRLLHLENLLDPSDYLMRRRIGWLVQVYDSIVLEDVDGSLRGRVAARQWREVSRFHI